MSQELKSIHSNEPVYIRFVNKTKRKVDIKWIDFAGQPVKYNSLLPDNYIDINTFESHPWIFEDSDTRDKLVVDNQFVFYPPSWTEIIRKRFPDRLPDIRNGRFGRLIVMITLPVYKLRERCLQVVRDSLTVIDEKFLDVLQLPKSVEDDLILMLLVRDRRYL